MKVHLTEDGRDDHQRWTRTDQDTLRKVNALVEDARRRMFTGLGKPEPLKGVLSGSWSRRIEGTRGGDRRIEITQCSFHHGD